MSSKVQGKIINMLRSKKMSRVILLRFDLYKSYTTVVNPNKWSNKFHKSPKIYGIYFSLDSITQNKFTLSQINRNIYKKNKKLWNFTINLINGEINFCMVTSLEGKKLLAQPFFTSTTGKIEINAWIFSNSFIKLLGQFPGAISDHVKNCKIKPLKIKQENKIQLN